MSVRRHGRNQRGAALLEGALVFPLFLIFWFGIVDWGITYFVHQSLVHQANSAARWAVVNAYNPDNTEPIKNMVVYNQPEAPVGASAGRFGLTTSNVTVTMLGTELKHDLRIVVTVSGYSWTHFTPFFPGQYTGRPIVVSLPTEDLE